MTAEAWKSIAQRKQAERDAKLPPNWRIPVDKLPPTSVRDVIPFPRESGLFTARELEITRSLATDITTRIATGQWSSVEVTEAFCKRAAVAQQLVNWYVVELVYSFGASNDAEKPVRAQL